MSRYLLLIALLAPSLTACQAKNPGLSLTDAQILAIDQHLQAQDEENNRLRQAVIRECMK